MSRLTLKSVLAAVLIATARYGLVVGNGVLIGWSRGPGEVDYSHQLLACVRGDLSCCLRLLAAFCGRDYRLVHFRTASDVASGQLTAAGPRRCR